MLRLTGETGTEFWLKRAADDLVMSEAGIEHDQVVDHCRQGLEILKAISIERAKLGPHPRTHDLIRLPNNLDIQRRRIASTPHQAAVRLLWN
jgi:HEPN domain-containing protein